jgi:hypothetical protein
VKYTVVALRLAVSALMLAAIVWSYAFDAVHGYDIWPWDWFGYFTNQNNLAAGFVLSAAAVALLRGRRLRWLEYARGAVTTYIFIVGSVYWTLLANTPPHVPWTNFVVHAIMPAYCLLDWLLIGDRRPLRYAAVPWVIGPYAVIWLGVTLARGATDGWVPYPFMDPASGYASVALYCGAIVVIALVVAMLFWLASRFRGLALRESPAHAGTLPAPARAGELAA